MAAVNDEVTKLLGEVKELRAQVENLRIERDACWQDLYEANRYSAWLSADRQAMIDRLSMNPHQQELESLRKGLSEAFGYVTYLERLVTEKEDKRFELLNNLDDPGRA